MICSLGEKVLTNLLLNILKRKEHAVRDSLVGTATCYGLDGSDIESSCGGDFPHPFRLALRPSHPPVKGPPGLFPGCKATGT